MVVPPRRTRDWGSTPPKDWHDPKELSQVQIAVTQACFFEVQHSKQSKVPRSEVRKSVGGFAQMTGTFVHRSLLPKYQYPLSCRRNAIKKSGLLYHSSQAAVPEA